MGFLGHLLHPHPKSETVPQVSLPEGKKFLGVMVLSPWITFSTKADAFKRNKLKDICTTAALDRWSTSFMGDAKEDPYNQPLSAPKGWWTGCNNIVNEVFVGGGQDEVMIDDIVAFGKQIQDEWKKEPRIGEVEIVVVPDEAHDSFIADRLFGANNIQMKVEVRRWMKKILQ
jgi:acetyl esterase/lipase